MSSEWAPKRIRLANKKEKFFDNEYTAIGKEEREKLWKD